MNIETSINNAQRIEYDIIWFMEHVLGENTVDLLLPGRKNDLKKRILEYVTKRGNKAQSFEVERRKNLSIAEFKNTYLRLGIPVVMEGAADEWECVKKWDPEFLANKYGDDKVSLIDASPDDYNNVNYNLEMTTLKDVILSMDEGPIKKYSRFNSILHDHPELKKDFDKNWLKSMRNLISSGETFQVFIGGKGTKTHIHCASEHNLFTQVYGRKHWIIYPPIYDCVLTPQVTRTPYFHTAFDPDNPDYENYPAMEFLDRYECLLEPGDVLFNPPSYWHHVKNLSGSIGVAFRWFAPYDSFRLDFMQALLTILSVNPPFLVAAKYRTNFPKIFSYMSRRNK
jgi:hypothetical protein